MNFAQVFRISVFILDIIGPFLLFWIVLRSFKSFRKWNSRMSKIEEEICHVHTLMDILASGIVIPPARQLYHKVREAGPGADLDKLSRAASLENFETTRKRLIDMQSSTEDPEKIAQLNKMVEELEGMYNLYSTLDENSSPEYAEQVTRNLNKSIQRILTGDFDEDNN